MNSMKAIRKTPASTISGCSSSVADISQQGMCTIHPGGLACFGSLKIKPLFLNRDLRDIVISYTYFITDKYPNHPLRPYLLSLPDRNQQFLALIQGIPELHYPSIAAWYGQFAGWSGEADCLQIAFEHLVDSHSSRRRTMEQLIRYLWADKPLPLPMHTILDAMEQNINPKASYTFRTGTTGNWRTEFNEEVKTCFKEVAGHLLFPAGYETDYNW